MERKKIIRVSKDNLERMMADHKCSRVTVYNALAYRSDSPNARLIRKHAIEMYGGVEEKRIVF